MFGFLLQQWIHGKITEERLKSFCPTCITEEEVKIILGRKQLV